MNSQNDLRTHACTPLFPDFAKHLQLAPGACELLRAAGTRRERMERLIRPFPVEAIRLLPALLPKRAAIWWGLLCAWEAHRENPSSKVQVALASALRWLQEPSELHRRECESAGNSAELTTSAGCVAKAAFWSEGSMSREGLPNVAPPAELTACLIGSSVLLAAVEKDARQVVHRYRQFMNVGLQVASGQLLWSEAAEMPATPLVELPVPPNEVARERILHWSPDWPAAGHAVPKLQGRTARRASAGF